MYRRLTYKEAREKMERKLANFKKGLIPREERLRMGMSLLPGRTWNV